MNRIDRPAACPDFLEVFSDFVDGTLPPDREGEIRAHLDCCEGCLRHLAAYRRGVMTLRAGEREVDPRAFWTALERRLWTEGHLAGGRAPAAGGAWWTHPAAGMAAAACFAVAVFFAGMWGDRALRGAGPGSGDRPVVVQASRAPTSPVVVPSEPIDLAGTTLDSEATPARPVRVARSASPVPVVRASLETRAAPMPTSDPVEREADVAYVAALDREVEADRAIDAVRRRPTGDGLRTAWNGSAVAADGWIEPVRLGTAGIRRIRQRVPVTAWPVEAALSVP